MINTSRYGFITEDNISHISRSKSAVAGTKSRQDGRGSTKVIGSIYVSKSDCTKVGICFLDYNTSELIMSTYQDSQTYVRTMHQLYVYSPTELLVLEHHFKPVDKLGLILQSNLSDGIKLIHPKAIYYNIYEGIEYLKKFSVDVITNLEVEFADKELCLAAANACIKSMILSTSSREILTRLKVKFQTCENTMLIDHRTIVELELVENKLDKKGNSLFKVLNKCCTKMGQRFLRNNILQPLTDSRSITLRYEAVQELKSNQPILTELRKEMKSLQNFDVLLNCLVAGYDRNDIKINDQKINNVLLLKSSLLCAVSLATFLTSQESHLSKEIYQILSSDDINKALELINESISEDCSWVSGSLELRNQKSFAVKSGKNGLLDISRQLYQSILNEVSQEVHDLAEEYNINLEYRFESNRGFFVRVKQSTLELLPDIFINRVQKRKIIECTTLNLMKQSSRFNDVNLEITILSDKSIDNLYKDLTDYTAILFMVCEAFATLDLLCCFAFSAMISDRSYCAPEISTELQIKNGRHPVLETVLKDKFVPNDYFVSKLTSRFQIITGANMSGKSVYLKQLSYLIIMGQMG
ncbi:DNA mismatch repair protein MutS [Scheffersomyces coipomensis]|uniref:DNA mismatch repair protein MutS n=1 Tax=Scheffersomyces coipomensis TaxID=1788519 RepID=UPI00315D42B9